MACKGVCPAAFRRIPARSVASPIKRVMRFVVVSFLGHLLCKARQCKKSQGRFPSLSLPLSDP